MNNVKLIGFCLPIVLCFALGTNVSAHERKTDKIVEILKSKGIISDKDVEAVSQETNWFENLTIGGTLELAFTYLTDSDRNQGTDSTSDLYLTTMELGIDAKVNDSTSATVVLLAEDIGAGGDERPACDEATFTIENLANTPLYVVAGKRALPFGQFYTHTFSDPLPHGAYEINKASLTLGAAVEKAAGLDTSLTIYKGEDMMDQIAAMGSSNAEDGPGRDATYVAADDYTDDVNSFIISASITPVEGLNAGIAYASEPGHDARNNTANIFAEYVLNNMTFDAEYFSATKRETYTDGQQYKEVSYAFGFAYQITDPFEAAIRYETFDNDRSTPAAGDIDYNIALGANYDLMDNIYLMFEVRCLNEFNGGTATYEEQIHEVNLLLGAGF